MCARGARPAWQPLATSESRARTDIGNRAHPWAFGIERSSMTTILSLWMSHKDRGANGHDGPADSRALRHRAVQGCEGTRTHGQRAAARLLAAPPRGRTDAHRRRAGLVRRAG